MFFGIAVVSAVVLTAALGRTIYLERRGEAFFVEIAEIAPQFVPISDASQYLTTLTPVLVTDTVERSDTHLVDIAEAEDDLAGGDILDFALDFSRLSDIMPGTVGWIQSYGTNINYPIVQGADNDFYLHHLPNGTRNPMGSIFLDYRNAPDFSDEVIIIYGHDMPRDNKFGSLRHYNNQAYFEQHPVMTIFTPDGNFAVVLFAGYILDAAFYAPPMSFEDYAAFRDFVDDVISRSVFVSNIHVPQGSQLVLLATCTPTGPLSHRFILVGKLIRI